MNELSIQLILQKRMGTFHCLARLLVCLCAASACYAPAAQARMLGLLEVVRMQFDDSLKVSGWACQGGNPASVYVDLYAGGSRDEQGNLIGRYPAREPSEPAVARSCRSTGSNYRFDVHIPGNVLAQYPGQAIFIHATPPGFYENTLIGKSGKFGFPLNADGNTQVYIGTPGHSGWAKDNTNYFTRWSCTSTAGISNIRKLKIMPLGNHLLTQMKDSLVAGPIAPDSARNPVLFFTLDDTADASSRFKMWKAIFDPTVGGNGGSWKIYQYLASLGNHGGVSSHAGNEIDYVYNLYYTPGWGPYASRTKGAIPGLSAQKKLWGSGPLGLTAIQSIVNNDHPDSNVRTCLHMNPSLFDYDENRVPRAFIATLWSGTLKTSCLLPPGAPLPQLPASGPYVYRYVNATIGWQLDLQTGLVENQGGLDYAMNADPLQNGTFVRAGVTAKVARVTLNPRQTQTILDCSSVQGLHFSEASRGPNGAYYFLVDEPIPTNLDPKVVQHDIFVAW